MKIKQKRGYLLKHSAAIISIIAAVLILVDFAIPGELYQTEINEVKKTRQSYYNPAGNAHYSYSIVTDNRIISVSKKVGAASKVGDVISYRTSLIFDQVNSYNVMDLPKENYSFRWVSGGVFPVIVIVFFTLCIAMGRKLKPWSLIMQILLIGLVLLLSQH